MGAQTTLRRATLEDVPLLAADIADGFATYLEWAPPHWAPPPLDGASLDRLAKRLERDDVWCLLALDEDAAVGHIGLSPVTNEEPHPAPAGIINVWQLFVRRRWHGSGVATHLMDAAVTEARRRGYTRLRLWTPREAARARGFYEREGWTLTGRTHDDSPSRLSTVEYERSTDPVVTP
jgi:GNAT superfamily N-acetyltransferase